MAMTNVFTNFLGPELTQFKDFYTECVNHINAFDKRVNSELFRADVMYTDNGYEILCDLPGVKKEDINIQYTYDKLVISGKRKNKREQEYLLNERLEGKFLREFEFSDIDSDKIQANYDNGVLSVKLHRIPNPEPKKIHIS